MTFSHTCYHSKPANGNHDNHGCSSVTTLWYVLFGASALVIIIGMAGYHGGAIWGRPLAGLGTIAAIAIAISRLVGPMFATSEQKVQAAYEYAAMQCVGEYLAELGHGGPTGILFIEKPATAMNELVLQERQKWLVAGAADTEDAEDAEDAFAVKLVRSPDIPLDRVDSTNPQHMSKYWTGREFDNFVKDGAAQCGVIVSMVGLPAKPENIRFWRQRKRPKLIVFNQRLNGLQKYIEQGKITAAVITHPEKPVDNKVPVPEDYREAFDSRYLLIDKKNVRNVAKKYPWIFKVKHRRK